MLPGMLWAGSRQPGSYKKSNGLLSALASGRCEWDGRFSRERHLPHFQDTKSPGLSGPGAAVKNCPIGRGGRPSLSIRTGLGWPCLSSTPPMFLRPCGFCLLSSSLSALLSCSSGVKSGRRAFVEPSSAVFTRLCPHHLADALERQVLKVEMLTLGLRSS
jgi:hypothetical protein